MIYDSTDFVSATIHEIVYTLAITGVIVLIVVFVFLQDWRATLIPALTIPVSLIGVFMVLIALGYSANTVTLFALILAIGLVVDDAIVVVENVQRVMDEDPDISPHDATIEAMRQVTGPIISTTLVLVAVFVPVAFLPGISGQLFRQFAVTMTASVAVSALNALTLSPALCALLLERSREARGPFKWFNAGLNYTRDRYSKVTGLLARYSLVAGLIVILIGGAAYWMFGRTPTAFIPTEDQGILFVNVQLPDAASLPRTQAVLAQAGEIARNTDGVANVIAVSGYSILSSALQPNTGLLLVVMKPWDERTTPETGLRAIYTKLMHDFGAIGAANIIAFPPPAIPGVGNAEGFDFRLEALGGQSPQDLSQVMRSFVVAANADPRIASAYTTFSAEVPGLYLDIDRVSAQRFNVPVSSIFNTLQAQLGSAFINNFNIMGQTYQVNIEADALYRSKVDDILNLYVRSSTGALVPVRSFATVTTTLQPTLLNRYNQFTSATINGQPAAGISSGTAMQALAEVAGKTLPNGYGFEWSGLSYQEVVASSQTWIVFAMALIFGYLFLVAQYESWTIPLRRHHIGRGRHPRRDPRHQCARPRAQHLLSDRPRPAHRPGRQERHPHRRVFKGKPRIRQEPRGSSGRRRPHALPRRADDGDRLHPRLGSAGAEQRRRCREPRVDRHHGGRAACSLRQLSAF